MLLATPKLRAFPVVQYSMSQQIYIFVYLLFTNSERVSRIREKAITYIDVDYVAVEDGRFGLVRRDVSVELVAVAVPLDGVELVALHVVVAVQLRVLPTDSVGRYRDLKKPD